MGRQARRKKSRRNLERSSGAVSYICPRGWLVDPLATQSYKSQISRTTSLRARDPVSDAGPVPGCFREEASGVRSTVPNAASETGWDPKWLLAGLLRCGDGRG